MGNDGLNLEMWISSFLMVIRAIFIDLKKSQIFDFFAFFLDQNFQFLG